MDATFAGIYLHSCEQLGHGVAGVGVEGGLDGVIDAVFKGSWELGYHHSP